MSEKPKTVPEILRAAGNTYEERNKTYGDNYKNFGGIMQAQFPNGLPPMDKDGWNRFGVYMMIQVKLSRYAESLARDGKGHNDTAHDIMVYGGMLEELTP